MDPRLLQYYNQELAYLREMGGEFAQQFPKIASRLGMEGIEVADPYVERLLEGAGFLAARVQVKLDAEFPRFTQRLLEIVYPNYLAPVPAMLVAQFQPPPGEANLASGFTIARGASMKSQMPRGEATACEFRTAHELTLWPIELVAASYFSHAPDLPLAALALPTRIMGGLRLRLKVGGGLSFDKLALDVLPIYLAGGEDVAFKLYELLLGASAGVLVGPPERPLPWYELLPTDSVTPLGFADEQALLPVSLRSFQGYRLLQEYYAFPQRFLFVELRGLNAALRRAQGSEVEITFLLSRGDAALESTVDAGSFALHCTPAINLFPKRADRIHLTERSSDHHVVVDRTRPMDFEVHTLTEVVGYGHGAGGDTRFAPLYAASDDESSGHGAYYAMQREPRLLSVEQKRNGARTSYVGSEVFLSIVDAREAPYGADLRQLAVAALVTNRDLPLLMPTGGGKSDFTLDAAAPVEAIRVLKGPSRPVSALREGNLPWRFVSHLSLNYLSLIENDPQQGAAALREMLGLYADARDVAQRKQIDGLRTVRVRPTVRRFPVPGRVTFGRGLEIELEVDDLAFQGGSPFLFGAVMERFIARAVSINSFVELALRSGSRGEIMRWVPRCGTRPIL